MGNRNDRSAARDRQLCAFRTCNIAPEHFHLPAQLLSEIRQLLWHVHERQSWVCAEGLRVRLGSRAEQRPGDQPVEGVVRAGRVVPLVDLIAIATAVGLAAAIPAVFFYNHFTTRVKGFATEMDDFSLEFLNISERNFT